MAAETSTDRINTAAELGMGYIVRDPQPPSKHWALQVERLDRGGYVVIKGLSRVGLGDAIQPLCACSTLDEALAFVRDNIMENAKTEPVRWSQIEDADPRTMLATLRSELNQKFYGDQKPRTRPTKPTRARKVK